MTATLEPDGAIRGVRPFSALPPSRRYAIVRALCRAYLSYAQRKELDLRTLNRLINTQRYVAGETIVLPVESRVRGRTNATCPDCGDYARRPLSDHECPVTAALAGQE